MKYSGADLVLKALEKEGVRWVFGIPGTHNIELYDRMAEEEWIRPVLITDEQSAAFLADGVARASGELAAINVVPGAGLTHAMSGIAECYLDQIALLVLSCGIRTDTGHSFQLHDIDQAAVVRPISKEVFQPRSHDEIYTAIIQACRLAKRPPCGPAVVEIPVNLYLFREEVQISSSPEIPLPDPTEDQVRKLVDLLNRSENIHLYFGLGAQEASEQLVELADRLDAIVSTSISAKGVFPENHPRWVWNMIGRAAPSEIRAIQERCDTMLAIGCRFGEVGTGSYGFQKPQTLIHADIDPGALNRNYSADLAIVSDSGTLVRAILEPGRLNERAGKRERLEQLDRAHRTIQQEQIDSSGEKVSPAILLKHIHKICGEETVFVCDSGNGTFLAMEHLRLSRPRSFLAPVDYSCMGYSVPAGIGAKLSRPQRPVAVLAGDGAFLMTGLELTTAANYKVGVMVFLLRDRELSQIAQFQKASFNRKTCTDLSDYSAADIAGGTGAEFLMLNSNDEAESVIRKAHEIAESGIPVVVEVAIDYSRSTYFSRGVVITNFLRFPWKDRLRLVTRVISRKLS